MCLIVCSLIKKEERCCTIILHSHKNEQVLHVNKTFKNESKRRDYLLRSMVEESKEAWVRQGVKDGQSVGLGSAGGKGCLGCENSLECDQGVL